MPRDGSNVYSKAAGTEAVSGQTVSSTKYNAAIDDIVNDLNTPRAVSVGGTGATTTAAARTALGVDTAITDVTGPLEINVTALQARPASGRPLVASVTAVGQASIVFNQFNSTLYSGYEIGFHGVSSSVDNDEIYLRTSSTGGPPFDNGATDYRWSETQITDLGVVSGAGAGSPGTNVLQIGSNLRNGFKDFNGKLTIHNPESTTSNKVFFGQFAYTRNAGFSGTAFHGRVTAQANIVNAVQIFAASGTLTGYFTLHGIAK